MHTKIISMHMKDRHTHIHLVLTYDYKVVVVWV